MSTVNGTFEHGLLVYDGPDEFVSAAGSFLRGGLEHEGLLFGIVSPPRAGALRDALGRDADHVVFADPSDWYVSPTRTVSAYADLARSVAPRRFWAVAELPWPDLAPDEEWIRYEAMVNAAFSKTPATVMCPYDRERTPPHVIDAAYRAHPGLHSAHSHRNPLYEEDLARTVRECDRRPLPSPPPGAARLPLTGRDLHPARSLVIDQAARAGLPDLQLGKLLVAVTELCENAVVHGTPPAELKAWAEDGAVVCEVADMGLWRPGPLTGYVPPAAGEPYGLWAARMLTDLVQIRAGWDGTRVRVRVSAE